MTLPTPTLARRLKPGDRVAIIAPSSPFDVEKFNKGAAVLKTMGLQPVFSDSLFAAEGYLAGTDAHRAALLQEAFADPDIQGVFCARGGYGAIRLLPLLDWEVFISQPKVLVGYSDVSALLNTIAARCGLVVFHGPMMTSLGDADPVSLKGLQEALFGPEPLTLNPLVPLIVKPGAAAGVVAGGNLATLCHLVGTPYQIDFSDKILFLEDIGEAPYRIDRMLTQMRLAGCLEKVAGVALGSFTNCGDREVVHRVFQTLFEHSDVPILAGFDAGHGDVNITLPLGLSATLDADNGRLIYHGPATFA